LRAVGDFEGSVVPLFLLRAHLYLWQSVQIGQPAGRPRRADSNRADGFRRKPWDWRDHLIGVRGSAACANNSVCPARLTRHARSGHWPPTEQTADLHGSAYVRIVSGCSIGGDQAIQSGVAGGCAVALELFAHATESRAPDKVVAPTAWRTKRIICASAQAPRRGRPTRWRRNFTSRRSGDTRGGGLQL